jgi:hypothetical protein
MVYDNVVTNKQSMTWSIFFYKTQPDRDHRGSYYCALLEMLTSCSPSRIGVIRLSAYGDDDGDGHTTTTPGPRELNTMHGHLILPFVDP